MAGERQGRGMGTAWARHIMCESAFIITISIKIRNIYSITARNSCGNSADVPGIIFCGL
jgi:hypothetical protein